MGSVSKTVIAGWIIELSGTALWTYGYFATGHPPLSEQILHLGNFLPNIEAEIGMLLVFVGMIPLYWPRQR